MATLAAEAQTIIVGAVTQDTNVLTATVVSAARVHYCKTGQMWQENTVIFQHGVVLLCKHNANKKIKMEDG